MSATDSLSQFFVDNIINVIAIIATGVGVGRYLEDRNNKKVDSAKKEMEEQFSNKVDAINKDIKTVKDSSDLVKAYIERDIKRLEKEIDDIQNRRYFGINTQRRERGGDV